MNRDKAFVLIVGSVLVVGLSFGIYLTKQMEKITYTLVHYPQLDMCYLVNNKFEVTPNGYGFKYASKSANGNVQKIVGTLTNTKKIPHENIDVFLSGDHSQNNLTLQYQVSKDYYFEDTYQKQTGGDPFVLPKMKGCDYFSRKVEKQLVLTLD